VGEFAGFVIRLPMIGAHWLPIVIAVVGSTIITMVVNAVVMRGLEEVGGFCRGSRSN
jgi:putative effector of murein hydrolase LrgA (UPF0299 family)